MAPTTHQPTELHPVIARLRAIEAELNQIVLGRAPEIRGSLLALAARQHVFLLGSPGSGKSYMSSELCRRIQGAAYFKLGLNGFTLRDELFGPISLSALRDRDALVRKVSGYLPAADIAQLDEIWKCPPATLHTLLTILNEREYRNDEVTLRAPLVSAFMTSNETPPTDHTLDALYDRILLRYAVSPLTDLTERRAATDFSIRMRAFGAEANRLTDELGLRATVGADPARYLLDEHGALFADPALRAAALAGMDPITMREPSVAPLLEGMLAWTIEAGTLLPYRTYLRREDLDTLERLVLGVELPSAVDEAMYRIFDETGVAVSVRREEAIRRLVAAAAVLDGRMTARVEDLDVCADALWDTPAQIPAIRHVVQTETGAYARELDALRATVASWASALADDSWERKLTRRGQIASEIRRIERFAAANTGDPAAAELLAEARALAADFEAGIFAFDGDGAPAEAAPVAALAEPGIPSPLTRRPAGLRVIAATPPPAEATPAPVINPPEIAAGPLAPLADQPAGPGDERLAAPDVEWGDESAAAEDPATDEAETDEIEASEAPPEDDGLPSDEELLAMANQARPAVGGPALLLTTGPLDAPVEMPPFDPDDPMAAFDRDFEDMLARDTTVIHLGPPVPSPEP